MMMMKRERIKMNSPYTSIKKQSRPAINLMSRNVSLQTRGPSFLFVVHRITNNNVLFRLIQAQMEHKPSQISDLLYLLRFDHFHQKKKLFCCMIHKKKFIRDDFIFIVAATNEAKERRRRCRWREKKVKQIINK